MAMVDTWGKRSADAEPKAEADAWYGYGGLYGYGLPAYGGYGYGGYYGKRSADAEPKAEADAWYGYGAFTDMASQPMADMAMVDTTARSKILSQLLAQKYTPK